MLKKVLVSLILIVTALGTILFSTHKPAEISSLNSETENIIDKDSAETVSTQQDISTSTSNIMPATEIIATIKEQPSNKISLDRMLLVLSAPSVHDDYYKPAFQTIIDFQINYITSIIGNDNVVLLVDADTKKFYDGRVPEDVLLTTDVRDIWMRDFTTVNPLYPVQFTYTWASMAKSESRDVQSSFDAFADSLGIKRTRSNYMIDGGNIVDNYKGRVITTTRFLEDNNLTYEKGKEVLKNILGATEVAILEPDEDGLAHSDGMVSWIADDILLVNDYSEDSSYRELVMTELKAAFPNIKIIEVPVIFHGNKPGEWEGFSSSCGVNLNATFTYRNIYVPTFGLANDAQVLDIIRKNTSKKVIPIPAAKVCPMGGSVRCLTWQVTGENAINIVEAAKSK
jgi:agmatine/peptidylarginine deiminase